MAIFGNNYNLYFIINLILITMIKNVLLAIFLLITTFVYSQIDTSILLDVNNCNTLEISNNNSKSFVACANPDLEYYLKRPPIISSYLITEDRNEKIELVLKDEYSFSQLEINFGQYDNNTGWEYNDYIMYDDGTHGDVVANDKTFTNDEVFLKYRNTSTYNTNHTTLDVIYFENGEEIHSDVFSPVYLSVNTEFLNNIEMPNVYRFENDDFLYSDNFIYYNKYNNWTEIECNQIGGVLDPDYIISKSLLYEFWEQNVINSQNDKNLYMQVDFIQPSGQFLYGQDIALNVNSLNGVEVHEILHYWIPNISSYLWYDPSDTHNSHHANIFRNTSGFLYGSWSRVNGIYCENSINDIETDSEGTYLYIDHTTSYERCNGELETGGDKLYYNDFELYLMNLIPIEDVEFPFLSLVNIYDKVEIIAPDTGYLIEEKYYFDSIKEVDQAQFVAAKNDLLNDLGNPPHLDASSPNNFLLTFSGNKSNLTNNEIKMLWVHSHDLTTTGEKLQNWTYSTNTFYQATGERAEITANIPLPLEYTGNFYTTEYITIDDGEEYQGWTESGVYERMLGSIQYNDSIVTTHLTVIPFSLPPDNFNIEVVGETCPNKNNGKINITANETHNYYATINGANYNFTNNSLTIEDLPPDTYTVCISVSGENLEQCYTVNLIGSRSVSGRAIVNSDNASITMEHGTAPYSVYINGVNVLNTNNSSFDISVEQGDLLEVKTAKACEGVFSKSIVLLENIKVYPNPSKGIFEITLPISENEVEIEIYAMDSQLISSRKYQVVNGKVKINIKNEPTGVYIVKINLDTPVSINIIKE